MLTSFCKLIIALPLPVWQKLAQGVGVLVYRINPKRTQVIRDNVDIAFNQLSESEKEALCKAATVNTIIGFFESFFGWWASDKRILKYSKVEGLDTFHDALDEGKGVIILGAHFTTMELSARVMGTREKVNAIYREHENPLFDNIIKTARQKYFNELIPKTKTRRLIKKLKAGSAIWYAVDQDAGRKFSVFPTFFGTPAATITATDKLVKLTGAKILFYSHFREGFGKDTQFIGRFHAPIDLKQSTDPLHTAQLINDQLETILTTHDVSQYFWVHRRYKTRPDPSDQKLYS